MGWEREYEHRRDMGHTWGPGVDDAHEYSEKELAELQKEKDTFQQLLSSYRVAPRPEYLYAGNQLRDSLPPRRDRIYGTVSYNWRQQYNDASIELCRKAAESLGFPLVLFDHSAMVEQQFAVAVDYYGWLPGRGGNVHRYAAAGIDNIEDCLQLVADFAATGKIITTYFDKHFHFCCKDTGALRYELEHWCERQAITLPSKERNISKASFADQLSSAKQSFLKNHGSKQKDLTHRKGLDR